MNPDTKAPARVGFEFGKDGRKTRVFKASRYSAKAEKPAAKAAAKKTTAKKADPAVEEVVADDRLETTTEES